MAKIVKVIEVMSEAGSGWEEAAQNVVSEASKSLRNIRSRNSRLRSRTIKSPIIG
jgi:flavin-binding protein dodecin